MKWVAAARAAPYFPPQTLIFLLLWLVLMIGGRSRLLADPGTLWHTVVGERMLSSGTLIRTDPFSFTAAGKPWTPQSWLAECAMALIHRMSGLDGLLLASATLLAALYTWAFLRLLRAGFHPLLAALLIALAMLASSFHFHARPHLLTLVFLGWTVAQLIDFEAGRITLRRLFALAPLFVLWANVHGGMIGGFGTLAVVAAGWVFVKAPASGGRKPPVSSQQGAYAPRSPVLQIFWLSLLVAACGLAAFVNPYGAALPRVWLGLVRSPLLPHLIEEHAPIWDSGSAAPAVLLFGVIYLAALLGVLPAWPRITWLVPLLWLALTCQHIRHGPLFAITALLALADMAPHVRWMRWLAHQGSDLFAFPTSPERKQGMPLRALLVPSIVVGAAVVLQLASCSVPVLGRDWAQLDRSEWPLDLLPELRQFEQNAQPGTPIFNDMLFGGFLIYYTPGLRVFIDDRCELYGDELLSAYARALGDEPAQIETWAAQYGFDTALVRTGNALDCYLQQAADWKMIRRTEAATLYRSRRTAGVSRLVDPTSRLTPAVRQRSTADAPCGTAPDHAGG